LLAKNNFRTKIGRGWASEASQKFWDPLLFSATLEASNFKFGTQLRFGEYLIEKKRLGPKLDGSGLGEQPKKLGTLFISATVEATT